MHLHEQLLFALSSSRSVVLARDDGMKKRDDVKDGWRAGLAGGSQLVSMDP